MTLSYKGITPKLGERVQVGDSAQVIGDVELGDHASVWMCAVGHSVTLLAELLKRR